MRLSDLRKLSIKKGVRIRFHLPNGMECILNEHGVAQIPALKAPPDFNLEEQLASVERFTLEPLVENEKQKKSVAVQTLTRDQLAALATSGSEAKSRVAEDDERRQRVKIEYAIRGPVAQLGARFHGMEEVESSNLSRSTKRFKHLLSPCQPRT